MSTAREPAARRRPPGIVVFVAAMTALLLVLVVGGNILFNRSLRVQPQSAPVAADPQAARAAAAAAPSAVPPAPAAADAPSAGAPAAASAFQPPSPADIPDDAYGEVVRLGEKIFNDTTRYAKPFVGNDLACVNCHLDGGRRADSAPLWASFIHYPAYRKKTGKVDTLASRIQGCFEYSMNGKAPPADHEIVTALQTYAFWMAKGAPVGTAVPGSGYPKGGKPPQAPDYQRGEQVYARSCALCHGADGQGQRSGETQVFPPLWGPRSFNWGAGMHQLDNAAAFIRANMPLGMGNTLSEQEAWDVAMFMNSHERPQDPRFTGSVEETRRKYHDSEHSLYGLRVNGRLLGSGR